MVARTGILKRENLETDQRLLIFRTSHFYSGRQGVLMCQQKRVTTSSNTYLPVVQEKISAQLVLLASMNQVDLGPLDRAREERLAWAVGQRSIAAPEFSTNTHAPIRALGKRIPDGLGKIPNQNLRIQMLQKIHNEFQCGTEHRIQIWPQKSLVK